MYFLDPILGQPVYQFLPKPEFSDFTVSGSGLPMGYRHWKYVSLCWSNSDIMATAPRGCVLLLHHKFASSKEKQMTKCI